jgi:hypothetical protein
MSSPRNWRRAAAATAVAAVAVGTFAGTSTVAVAAPAPTSSTAAPITAQAVENLGLTVRQAKVSSIGHGPSATTPEPSTATWARTAGRRSRAP